MRVQMAVDVRVKQRNHEASGTTSWLTPELLAFSLRGKALSRGLADITVELYGSGRSISASVRILTAELGGVGRRNNYTARIMEISRGDQARLDAWIEERSRPASRSASRSAAAGGRKRKELGAAMKAGLGKAREATEAAVVATPAPAPDAPKPEDELVLAPNVTLAGDGSSMSVAWANWKSVTASWDESLKDGTLRVYLDGRHPPRNYSLIVQLCLPDGSVHATLGRVEVTEPPTLYLNMTLKESVKKALSRE